METFRDRYERMSNDELVEIALTTELMPEAKVILMQILASRGIPDLAPFKAVVVEEMKREEEVRESKIERRAKYIRLRTWLLLAMAAFFLAFGAYKMVWPDATDPSGGSTMMVIGVGVMLFAFVTKRTALFWQRHVLYRRAPSRLKGEGNEGI
ncbi:hypothetical protein [Dyella mobilis]|uniref:Holin-X, holin superfamily III n=1 Tax=Dyella mobilis TaxID=1849582 RepID=A0ABS2KJD8_9GAMM|nr:hypothetical protein [Dyella mobilis]MBM7131261.1 hypothetical protein [Dyella mobilis]GLQ98802.1 hypothetical protein GCM10007863_32220 [Dyella mobilis]